MALNAETAAVAASVRDFLKKHPDLHDQFSWVDEPYNFLDLFQNNNLEVDLFLKTEGCGTTRCVAGQAVITARPDLLTVTTSAAGWDVVQLDYDYEWDVLGEKVLGLERRDAHQLFFIADNDQALRALDYLAEEKVPDWKVIYENDGWEYPSESDPYLYDDWSDWAYRNHEDVANDPDVV